MSSPFGLVSIETSGISSQQLLCTPTSFPRKPRSHVKKKRDILVIPSCYPKALRFVLSCFLIFSNNGRRIVFISYVKVKEGAGLILCKLDPCVNSL